MLDIKRNPSGARFNIRMTNKRYQNPRKKIRLPLQREVRVEANHACVICKARVSLELHHIDGNRENNVADNLICICGNCHGMAHDRKISPAELREYKKRVKQEREELIRAQQFISYLTSSKKIEVSSDFASLQLKYQKLLADYSDKLIFYQCFIYLIPEFYIDSRGEEIRQVIRQILSINPEEENIIISQLIHLGIVAVTGSLLHLKNNTEAKIALSELISSGRLDIDLLIKKFGLI